MAASNINMTPSNIGSIWQLGCRDAGIAELEAHLRELVLATHFPVRWLIADELPKTVSLKVDRPAVARLFQTAHKEPAQ